MSSGPEKAAAFSGCCYVYMFFCMEFYLAFVDAPFQPCSLTVDFRGVPDPVLRNHGGGLKIMALQNLLSFVFRCFSGFSESSNDLKVCAADGEIPKFFTYLC